MLIITIFDIAFQAYWWILMARFLITWLPNINYGHPIIEFLFKVTDPIVRPFQGIVPPYRTSSVSVDFSPLILFLVLRLAYPLVRSLLVHLVLRF